MLHRADIARLNKNLLKAANTFRPDLFLEAGGHRILPDTIGTIRKIGIKTALWTIDPPSNFAPVIQAASGYDHVFTGDSEVFNRNCIYIEFRH